ncbi:MAG: ComEC/Rec2 family competence protein [Acidobacteriota bacterium]
MERELIREDQIAAAQVLKVAHHGSRNSTSPKFLIRVAPRLAVISVGARNPWGHPDPEVLARLRIAGIPALRTDRNGAVTVSLAPSGLEITTLRP